MGRIVLTDVKKCYGDFTAIHDINLEVEDGQFVVLVGPSGCGKSTLLRLIAGLEDCTSGKIFIDDQDVTNRSPAQRQLSMVFQSYALYPHMTVRGNIAFGLKMAKEPRPVIEEKVKEAARILDLTPLLDRKPGQLSGGQRQRVAIGRAIVRHPKAFLLDEPLSNLDAALRVQMRLEIAQLHQSLATTMVYVTHDQVEAMTLADKIVVLHDGVIEQVGSPIELYEHPDNQFVAGFIGSPKMNFIDNGATPKNGTAVLGIRPEHINISSDAGDHKGQVKIAEHLGSDTLLYVDTESLGTVTVRASGEVSGRPGDTVWLSLPPDLTHHFDSDGRAVSPGQH